MSVIIDGSTINVIVSDIGIQGLSGKSAYEIAVENGYIGTEADFVSITTRVFNKFSGETIPAFTPIAVIDDIAYKLDSSTPSHQFAYYGFSINDTNIGETCQIQEGGEIEQIGWGLVPNSVYLAGQNGTIVLTNITPTDFKKNIGYAITADRLSIIKDFSASTDSYTKTELDSIIANLRLDGGIF